MTIVYEIAIRADVGRTDAIRRWFETGPAKMWREIPQLGAFDAYFRSSGHPQDPYVDDGPGPRVLCMLTFADERLATACSTFPFVWNPSKIFQVPLTPRYQPLSTFARSVPLRAFTNSYPTSAVRLGL